MQYRTGRNAVEKENNTLSSIVFSIFNALLILPITWHEITKDIATKNKNPRPICFVFLPRLVVNSMFSLSKVSGLLTFTIITADANTKRAKITPIGCGIMYPIARLRKNSRENIIFQKLSLLSLEATKPVCIVTEFCSSVTLICSFFLQNVAKSSMNKCGNYWFKTYSSIISTPYHVLKVKTLCN